MMARPESKPPFGDEAILPLINVAFLLLIFFLAAATLQSPRQAAIAPPEAASGAARDTASVELAVDAGGAMWLAGEPVGQGALAPALRALRGGEATGLVVRIDRTAEAVQLAAILADAALAGFARVELVTVGPGQ